VVRPGLARHAGIVGQRYDVLGNKLGGEFHVSDYIVYNRASGVLSYDADGSSAGHAVAFALLTNKPVLTASDFLVI
jgi:Ca2+-binding RTX toxin-like protein